MAIRKPVPQHPRDLRLPYEWSKWYSLISSNSVRIVDFDVVFNPITVAASTSVEQDVSVPGLGENDIPLAFIKPTLTAGIGVGNIRVKASGVISVTLINASPAPVDPPSETYKLVVIRQ